MTELWKSKVTIYNSINETSDRQFERFVIDRCQVQTGVTEKLNGTIRNVVNAKTVITKDVGHYKSPLEYAKLPAEERVNYYTVSAGDVIVFDEVDDVVTTAQEFAQLQTKYKNNSMKVTTVSVNINGMAVDNITMTNA